MDVHLFVLGGTGVVCMDVLGCMGVLGCMDVLGCAVRACHMVAVQSGMLGRVVCIVTEYYPRGSLADVLDDKEIDLSWQTRTDIMIGARSHCQTVSTRAHYLGCCSVALCEVDPCCVALCRTVPPHTVVFQSN